LSFEWSRIQQTAMHASPRLFAEAERKTAVALYKSLIRKCEQLPKKEITDYYKNYVRQVRFN
jgi:hypothetical protein